MPRPPRRRPRERPSIEAVAAGIAHEVRNPLNAIQLNLRILEQELSELVPDRGARVYAVLARVAGELGHLDNFVAEFLRYARPPRIKVEPANVRQLLVALATFIAPECARRGVDLRVATARGPKAIVADAFQLKHAVLNLVLNALDATRPGGHIVIETGRQSARPARGSTRADSGRTGLVIRVRDDGEGIPADVVDRIFDAFYTTREGGTGLGLPIARRIVEEHGGTLSVESAPGQGTTATLTLPTR